MRSSRARLFRRIRSSRKRRVKTFRKISSIRVKKAILLNRYDVKVRYYERGIERLEKLLLKYRSAKKQTPYVTLRIASINTFISKPKSMTQKVYENKKKVHRLNNSSTCSMSLACAANLHKILNVIHINLVMKSRDGKRTINKKIIVSRGHVIVHKLSNIHIH